MIFMTISDNQTQVCDVSVFRWNCHFKLLWSKFSTLDNFTHVLCDGLKVKNSRLSMYQQKVTLDICSQVRQQEILFRIKSPDPDHRLSNHRTTISCLGSAGVPFSVASAARGLSLIELWGFCLAFPITSSTVSSQRAQKQFAESSTSKAEMVRLMKLSLF